MALIDAAAHRSASVMSIDPVIAAWVRETDFRAIAEDFPHVWRRLAIEMSERLRQRNRFHTPPNARPHLFIGSSKETLGIALALQSALSGEDLVVRVWTDGIFEAGETSIDSLLAEMDEADFAVLILGSDDLVEIRGSVAFAPRDNVVFELGLFMGRLGKGRALVLKRTGEDLRIPTDLLGLTPLETDSTAGPLDVGVQEVAAHLRKIIAKLGPR